MAAKELLVRLKKQQLYVCDLDMFVQVQLCNRTKDTRAPCRIYPEDRAVRIMIAKRFRDKILNEDLESRLHHRHAVVVQNLAT